MAGQQIKELPEVTTTTTSDKVPFQKASNDQTSYATLENLIPNGSIGPEKRSGGVATGTVDLSSTGTKSVTGLGFAPKWVEFYGTLTSSTATCATSVGHYDGTNIQNVTTVTNGTDSESRAYTDRIAVLIISGGAASTLARITPTSLTSDGFNYTVVNSTASATLFYKAHG